MGHSDYQREISIHLPLAGRDITVQSSHPSTNLFQSTRPSRGETDGPMCLPLIYAISIHSPLAGRDVAQLVQVGVCDHFNPLAPRGARLPGPCNRCRRSPFQSTRPSRGETRNPRRYSRRDRFQSTRPSRGETACITAAEAEGYRFQSTRPSRGETSWTVYSRSSL